MTNHTSRPATARRAARTALSLLIASCFAGAVAAPTLPEVVAGQATFSRQGNVFSITNAPNTVINWQSFSVNAGEITRFIQQGSDSAVLNRIVGQDPTKILGALQSNGHVFLINPNGIMFGKDARIDVNGLTASTLNLSNADFLAGKKRFTGGAQAGAIANHGSISTPSGGQVFLIASSVNNAGIITSPQGQVMLAAGHTVQLVDSSNPDLQVVVSAPSGQSINLGQIIAQGGRVGIYGALVNQRGVINADSAHMGANGKIVLKASGDAMLEAGSVTSATGAGTGGQVSVEGQRVGMLGDARIDASGATGGGSVLLGGGYQGKDARLANAQQTLMGRNASIRADAATSGNGGTVVLWGDASTRALGVISAQGGAQSGNGGLVETSGKQLDVNGIRVSAGAANGANGTWLLDPVNIEITSAGAHLLSDADDFLDLGTGSALISPATINSVGSATNVLLQATSDVTISEAISPGLVTGVLQIEAGNNININAPVSTSGGAINLSANHTGYATGEGTIYISPAGSLTSGGGNVTMKAAGLDLAGPINTLGGNLDISGGYIATFYQNVSTAGGAFNVSADSIDFAGTGALADSGSGGMSLTSGAGTFSLGAGWTLSSGGFIDVFADAASLLGHIGPSSSIRPILTFGTVSAGLGIEASGSATGGSLILDPSRLAAFDVNGIVLGNSSMTGNIIWSDAYSGGLANTLTLNTQGDIHIAAPLTLASGAGSAVLLDLDGTGSTSSVTVQGAVSADNITVMADNMSLQAPLTASSRVNLMPHQVTSQIILGGSAIDSLGKLALDNTELALVSAPTVAIGGAAGQSGAVTVEAAGANFSGMGTTSQLKISAGEANLTLNGDLLTAGTLFLQGNDLQTASTAAAKAGSIFFSSTFGIGASQTAFKTETSQLSAANQRDGGLAPINIVNTGNAVLGSIHQNGTGNEGLVSVINYGSLDLPSGESVIADGAGTVLLKAIGGPLTIDGDVTTASGGIALEALSPGVLSIGGTSTISSTSGNIGLTAGGVVNNGTVVTTSGHINVTAASVSGTGTYSAPGGTITGVAPAPVEPEPTPAPPSVSECVADSSLEGCTVILSDALKACIVNPAGADCALVLPSLDTCVAAPTTLGCSVVLPTMEVCLAAPGTAGCAVILPTLETCIATPTATGCSVVLPTLDTCIATPTAAGCSVVLPTLDTCIANPTAAGCSVVLPTLDTCIATPTAAGCSVVLPTLDTCIATPTAAGCAVVLPALPTCIAEPGTGGCSAVLPTLQACIGDTTIAGCTVVLPSLASCIVNPAGIGCSVVLPSLSQCIANPAATGCAAVLPSLAACIAVPSTPGCSVVLPTLSQCVANPTLPGCAAVLPTLAQCIGSPTLQGCSVVLPPVSACVANPTAPGCTVVAPPIRPPANSPVDVASKSLLAVLKETTDTVLPKDVKAGEKDRDRSIDGPADKLPGDLNEIRKKTYCN